MMTVGMIGVALFWGLISCLWMPWIDAAKSYRATFNAMKVALPSHYQCMGSTGLGESERAMLRYVLGINTQRKEIIPSAMQCDVFLVDGLAQSPPHDMDSTHWKQIWEGARLA